MATDDQLVKVGGLLSGEPVEAQIGQDEQTSLYRPVDESPLRGTLGVGFAMSDQRSLSRPEPSSPWPASTASPGRCAAAPHPPPSSGDTAPPAPGSGRASQPFPAGPGLVQAQLDTLAGRVHLVSPLRQHGPAEELGRCAAVAGVDVLSGGHDANVPLGQVGLDAHPFFEVSGSTGPGRPPPGYRRAGVGTSVPASRRAAGCGQWRCRKRSGLHGCRGRPAGGVGSPSSRPRRRTC